MEVSTKEREEKPNSSRLRRLIEQPGKQNLKKEKKLKNQLSYKKILAAASLSLITALLIPLVASATPTLMTGEGNAHHLTFEGSTTAGPIIQLTAPDYTTYKGSSYFADPADILQNGSGDGIQALIQDMCDIGMSSRALKTTAGSGVYPFTGTTGASEADVLNDNYLARDGVIFIVNTSVDASITQLTMAQISGIYNGTITNWNVIAPGTASMPIVPRARQVGSGTRQTVLDLTVPTITNEVATITTTREGSNQAMHDDISLATATGQIGYVGLGFDSGANIRSLKVVDSSGTAWTGSDINIYCNVYPYTRWLHLLTLKNEPDGANAQDVADFITWVRDMNLQGQTDVFNAGFLPLVPDCDVKVLAGNTVTVGSLINIGTHMGETGSAHWIRADVKRTGTITVGDLIAVGKWINVTYVAP